MWTCPKCGEQIDDMFSKCLKCADPKPPPLPSKEVPEASDSLEKLCLVVAFLPGIIFTVNGRAQNPEQATFRILTIIGSLIVGIGGFVAIKLYRRSKKR